MILFRVTIKFYLGTVFDWKISNILIFNYFKFDLKCIQLLREIVSIFMPNQPQIQNMRIQKNSIINFLQYAYIFFDSFSFRSLLNLWSLISLFCIDMNFFDVGLLFSSLCCWIFADIRFCLLQKFFLDSRNRENYEADYLSSKCPWKLQKFNFRIWRFRL